jgi:hypothetical protein
MYWVFGGISLPHFSQFLDVATINDRLHPHSGRAGFKL